MMEENKNLMLAEGMELGKVFAESGTFPDIKSAAQGCIKVLAGRELGLSPMQSLNSFYFVNGRLGIMAQTMGALVKKSGKYDYTIVKLDEIECVIKFFRVDKGEPAEIGESIFTFKDAAKAGIVNKDNWKNYPRNMLFSRALMNGIRWYCPDAVSAFTYSVEELEDLPITKREEVITINKEGEVEHGEV